MINLQTVSKQQQSTLQQIQGIVNDGEDKSHGINFLWFLWVHSQNEKS